MKVFIVGGAGVVGSSTAFCLAIKGTADEIVLQDLNFDMAQSHAMDISQAIFLKSSTKVKAGTWEDAAGADLVIIGAGLSPNRMTHDPCKDIAAMMPLINSICNGVRTCCPDAVVLSLTNPLDVFNYVLYQRSGLKERQVVGLAANDSIRFRWALGHYFDVDPSSVDAYAIGQHAADVIPLFSTVRVNSVHRPLEQEAQQEVEAWMKDWWKHFLDVSANRTAGWTTGAYAALTAEHIMGSEKGPICASVILEEGLAIDLPVYLGSEGIVRTALPELTASEQERFEECKKNCREKINKVLTYIS
ncbi:MAG: hypothetical protein IJJ17_00465 [Parasporobacterium sp.]|nr:hypothetical protein [Parasporobacterium sp.]